MPKYLVITASIATDQILFNMVRARNRKEAFDKAVANRTDESDGHLIVDGNNPAVYTPAELRKLAADLEQL